MKERELIAIMAAILYEKHGVRQDDVKDAVKTAERIVDYMDGEDED